LKRGFLVRGVEVGGGFGRSFLRCHGDSEQGDNEAEGDEPATLCGSVDTASFDSARGQMTPAPLPEED
jgi:hypothetical protein